MIRGLLLVLVAATGCADDDGPRLTAVSPSAAARNTMVTLTGQRLCGASADCAHAAGEVLVGLSPPQVQANVVTYDATSAQVVIPAIASLGATHLIVTVDDRSSNALAFEVLP
ncbi:MAG: hypothetical protein IPQ07_31960 [Myxococcales bacterium]|nr:hypothetical protein [Myxococcales bacterium]